MVNFAEALNTKAGDIERPPLVPVGHYRVLSEKVPALDSVADGKYDIVDFQLKVLEALEDVDADELAEFGSIADARLRRRFMFDTEDESNFKRSLYNLKRFLLEHLQVDGNDKTDLKELLNNSINQECIAQVRWTTDKRDGETQYAEVGRTAPVE